ncbi:MAG: DNA mismatch repair protein MutS, partial [Nannocystaceae bacterium]
VPYHAIGGYLRTLVERGYKVAICEQMETPEQARKRKVKIVRREVVRVVTPGVLLDEEHLQSGELNFLIAIAASDGSDGKFGVAALDVSCGEFVVSHASDAAELRAELSRLSGREIVIEKGLHEWLEKQLGPDCPRLEPAAVERLSKRVNDRVKALHAETGGQPLSAEEGEAAALALTYAEATQPGQTLLIHRLRREETGAHLVLDEASLRNLEIFRTLREGKRRGSLLWAVDGTRTAMGARMLRTWLGAPLREPGAIRERQDGVEAFANEPRIREQVQTKLKDVRDIVRLAARARLGTITPRELGSLRSSLGSLPDLKALLQELVERRTDQTLPAILDLGEDLLGDLHSELARTLVDEPPSHARDGGIIRSGADPELDRQLTLRDGGREALAAIETREREVTKIQSLKVQHNRVFGYFLEVPKAHLSRVPKHYVRKQTLANAERYVTEELADHETQVLGAQAAALVREQQMFSDLRALVSKAGERLCQLGERLAVLDVLAGLAELAEGQGYVRPEVVDEPLLEIEEGRHPVVERMQVSGQFVPNSVSLRARAGAFDGTSRFVLLTGPNMGGKSTVMRQVGLIALLAHIGSFVPAVRAKVGVVDRIFTRVGAADDLGRGESTFMVEMREAAQILSHASDRSLVLLDEIGRGTATFDGLALAWSITEFLHDQIGCRTIFATHYHELCGLSDRLPGLRNLHVAVHEHRGNIIFLHRLEEGPAERSYGIQVGRLAGLPAQVLRRAQRILSRLEASERAGGSQLDLFARLAAGAPSPPGPQGSEGQDTSELVERLRALKLDELSPRDAHEQLRELHEIVAAR